MAVGLLLARGMETELLRVAVLARDAEAARALAARLQAPGLQPGAFALEAPAEALAAFEPRLAVVLLEGLERLDGLAEVAARLSDCPLVLAGEVPWPQVWLLPFATGVVGSLPVARVQPAALAGLVAVLPGRPGAIRGSGAYGELPDFLASVAALGRTGTLEVQSVTLGLGRGELVQGQPGEARFGQRTGGAAWEALRGARGSWLFREHAPAGPGAGPAPAELDPRAVRLLVVHEDTACLAARADHLARLGFQVVTAHDRAGATQALARGPFDAAVLDLFDGAELARQLAADLRSRETALVLAGAPAGPPRGAPPAPVEAAVRAVLARRALALAQLRGWRLDDALALDAGALGVQWLLRQLESHAVTGTLTLQAGRSSVQVWFIDGRLCQAASEVAWGLEALAPLLTAPGVTATLEVAGLPEGEGFSGASTGAVLESLVARAEALLRPPGAPLRPRASGVYRAA